MNDLRADELCEMERATLAPRRRRKRTVIPSEDLDKLESLFAEDQWPGRLAKKELAAALNKSEQFVSVWFQNKRARVKRQKEIEQHVISMRQPQRSFNVVGYPNEQDDGGPHHYEYNDGSRHILHYPDSSNPRNDENRPTSPVVKLESVDEVTTQPTQNSPDEVQYSVKVRN